MRVFGFNSALITKFPPREERTPSHDVMTLPFLATFKAQFPLHFYKVSLLESLRGDRHMMTLPFLAGGNFEDKIYVLEFWRGNKKMSLA